MTTIICDGLTEDDGDGDATSGTAAADAVSEYCVVVCAFAREGTFAIPRCTGCSLARQLVTHPLLVLFKRKERSLRIIKFATNIILAERITFSNVIDLTV